MSTVVLMSVDIWASMLNVVMLLAVVPATIINIFATGVNLIKCFGVNILTLFVEPYLFRAFEGRHLQVVK